MSRDEADAIQRLAKVAGHITAVAAIMRDNLHAEPSTSLAGDAADGLAYLAEELANSLLALTPAARG